ncbi:hypothetical protein AOL_s00091g19 [Orbilia oligospora ATCC 24927]|uniref:Uncharacterized protein n=1 Tax=Arthrobotrys oligospora (strain ATCC 24927 / CBS 115.81 / DSM 1491) TaxID=756982 RepID=G1XHW7_ARTOA|nr:hypothetical protein AOL_s00091g19 [Orbilia oligospora ATCC 24927]EGX47275.1 hypothetical protein AOL_s00091g19 [Orbilia oligospora ATCC 24927]
MALKQPTDLRYPLPPKPRLTQNWHPRGPDGHVGDLGTTQRLSRQSLQIQTTVAVPALAPELHESIEPPLSRSPLPDKLEAGDNTSTAGNDASLDYSKNNSIIIKSPGQASLPSALPYPVDSLKDSTSQQHLLGSQMTRKKTKRMVRRSLDASWPYSSPQYKLKTPKVKTTKTTTSKPTGIPVPGKFRRRQPKAREWTVEKEMVRGRMYGFVGWDPMQERIRGRMSGFVGWDPMQERIRGRMSGFASTKAIKASADSFSKLFYFNDMSLGREEYVYASHDMDSDMSWFHESTGVFDDLGGSQINPTTEPRTNSNFSGYPEPQQQAPTVSASVKPQTDLLRVLIPIHTIQAPLAQRGSRGLYNEVANLRAKVQKLEAEKRSLKNIEEKLANLEKHLKEGLMPWLNEIADRINNLVAEVFGDRGEEELPQMDN